MADVGLPANYVDTQDVNLTNVSDSLTYRQLLGIRLEITRTVTKRYLTDDRIENLTSMRQISMTGDMILTQPEVAALIVLTGTGAAAPVSKLWKIDYVDASNNNVNMTINGQLITFEPNDDGLGVVTANFRLEVDEVLIVA